MRQRLLGGEVGLVRVSLVGAGKLGLPVAYAMASRGLSVYAYDPAVWGPPEDTSHEEGLAEVIEASGDRVHFCDLTDAVNNTDGVIFIAVQTPHEPRFEGVTPLPDDRADFDYTFLIDAVTRVVKIADALEKDITLAVISTVLPGALEREIVPLLSERVRLVYNPSFIAMGTTVRDFLDPEFILLGGEAPGDMQVVLVYDEVFGGIDNLPEVWGTSIRDAELIKVAYNTFIGLKIAFANTLMEICHKTGGDVDEVTGALKLAHRRLISGAYMDGGMGDGGGCHPRDNIALSWLASELDLSYDLFGAAMEARERQAEWLADMMEISVQDRTGKDARFGILGYSYKPESHITTGSAALLVKAILEARGHFVNTHDPWVDYRNEDWWDRDREHGMTPGRAFMGPGVWLIGCKHPEFVDLKLPEGSIVIDPFRYIPDQEGVQVVRVGQRPVPHNGSARESHQLSEELA
jgi:UDPglucose 6-dehydrogenase